tara:strand:+ start:528 stop:749 length:222 start_codon:yes stop_codon:yes gene_type:complete
MKDIKHQTYHGIVYTDGSFKTPKGDVLTQVEMKEAITNYRGANRIYKPMSLLYYTDVMNGHARRWETTISRNR